MFRTFALCFAVFSVAVSAAQAGPHKKPRKPQSPCEVLLGKVPGWAPSIVQEETVVKRIELTTPTEEYKVVLMFGNHYRNGDDKLMIAADCANTLGVYPKLVDETATTIQEIEKENRVRINLTVYIQPCLDNSVWPELPSANTIHRCAPILKEGGAFVPAIDENNNRTKWVADQEEKMRSALDKIISAND